MPHSICLHLPSLTRARRIIRERVATMSSTGQVSAKMSSRSLPLGHLQRSLPSRRTAKTQLFRAKLPTGLRAHQFRFCAALTRRTRESRRRGRKRDHDDARRFGEDTGREVPTPISDRVLSQSGLPPSVGTPDFSLTKNRAHDRHRTRRSSGRRSHRFCFLVVERDERPVL